MKSKGNGNEKTKKQNNFFFFFLRYELYRMLSNNLDESRRIKNILYFPEIEENLFLTLHSGKNTIFDKTKTKI